MINKTMQKLLNEMELNQIEIIQNYAFKRIITAVEYDMQIKKFIKQECNKPDKNKIFYLKKGSNNYIKITKKQLVKKFAYHNFIDLNNFDDGQKICWGDCIDEKNDCRYFAIIKESFIC